MGPTLNCTAIRAENLPTAPAKLSAKGALLYQLRPSAWVMSVKRSGKGLKAKFISFNFT